MTEAETLDTFPYGLLPEVVEMAGDVPVLAARRVWSSGAGLAAALAMGAQGVVMGTRFLAAAKVTDHAHLAEITVGGGTSRHGDQPYV